MEEVGAVVVVVGASVVVGAKVVVVEDVDIVGSEVVVTETVEVTPAAVVDVSTVTGVLPAHPPTSAASARAAKTGETSRAPLRRRLIL
jgi:hypothetical protein